MKRFIETKFFLAIRDASQTDVNVHFLQRKYEDFVKFLFLEFSTASDSVEYRNALVYTRVELSGLRGVSEKKRSDLS